MQGKIKGLRANDNQRMGQVTNVWIGRPERSAEAQSEKMKKHTCLDGHGKEQSE